MKHTLTIQERPALPMWPKIFFYKNLDLSILISKLALESPSNYRYSTQPYGAYVYFSGRGSKDPHYLNQEKSRF